MGSKVLSILTMWWSLMPIALHHYNVTLGLISSFGAVSQNNNEQADLHSRT